MTAALHGRDVVVTGATGELGWAVATRLLRAGATCHLPCRASARAAELVRELGDLARVTPGVDLTDDGAVRSYFDSLPAIDGSVHCAGGYAPGSILEITPDALASMMQLNLLPTALCTRAAIASMRRHRRGGSIVNVAALAGLEPQRAPDAIAYAASKAAVIGLTRAVAAGAAREGIVVNAIAPDAMDTPANRASLSGDATAALVALDSVAATIEWLLSPDARSVSGVVVPCIAAPAIPSSLPFR